MFSMNLGHHPIVLGIPWLRLQNVAVQFATNTDTDGSQYCGTYHHDAPVMVQGETEEPPEPIYPKEKGSSNHISVHRGHFKEIFS